MRTTNGLLISALIAAASIAAPALCHAQNRCVWLNAATAAGLLGGEVQMTVTVAPDAGKDSDESSYSAPEQLFGRPDALCEFTRTVGSSVSSLRIDVKTMTDPVKQFASYLATCKGMTVVLKAIGNEAVQCVMKDSAGIGLEQVIGRVRERAFVLTVIRTPAPAGSGDTLRDDTRNIAEQVAGSLF